MSVDTAALIREFREKSLPELENIFAAPAKMAYPTAGCYAGTWLRRIENSGSYKPFNLISQWLLFEITPFGITFNSESADGAARNGIWYFFHPAFATGNFHMVAGQSRWRNTPAVAMNYGAAELPAVVRNMLYDEVKPLTVNHCIGIGGFDAPTGDGDNFYFLLTRV